ADAFDRAERSAPDPDPAPPGLIDAVFNAIPPEIRPARFTERIETSNRAKKRFYAAHAFANWTTHSNPAIRVWMRSTDASAALLEAGAGVRHADLLLRHLADGEELLQQLGRTGRGRGEFLGSACDA